MVHFLHVLGADVAAVENYLATKSIKILLDVVVLYHDNHHVDVFEKCLKIRKLVLGDFPIFEEWVIAFQRTGKMPFLGFK